MRLLDDER
jgi:hypothetical protein